MASDSNDRSGLLTAGGILSIVAGAFEIAVAGIVVSSIVLREPLIVWLWPFTFRVWPYRFMPVTVPTWVFIGDGLLLALGILAVVGGISAIRRKRFGLSLAGAISALPSVILGILAVIFVALGKREFGAKV